MTKLHTAVKLGDNGDSSLLDEKEIYMNQQKNKSNQSLGNINESEIVYSVDDLSSDAEEEPLGCQHFLYDVNIEYQSGGNQTGSSCNKQCFRMKYLPYMVDRNRLGPELRVLGIKRSIENCDHSSSSIADTSSLSSSQNTLPIDVSKTTCAFLGNSDYVPTRKDYGQHVIVELISAKLSQSTTHSIPANSSFTNLIALAEVPSASRDDIGAESRPNSASLNASTRNEVRGTDVKSSSSESRTLQLAPSQISSKKYVNYTILLRTTPGLDKQPAVIERRFSDFLSLYQGLKSDDARSNIVDKYVAFPKKIYMGNFSLTKIAERSIEFIKLLNLSLSKVSLLWSAPVISFLVDKELTEAHRLLLFGDPDDVQALIETAYFIGLKLYFKRTETKDLVSSSCSSQTSNSDHNSPQLPPVTLSQTNDSISLESSNTNAPMSTVGDSLEFDSNHSICNSDEHSTSFTPDKSSSAHVNQRLLVTFCMLFIVYCRGDCQRELKQAVCEFVQLISSTEYIESLLETRHCVSLRACLLFLMNMNQEYVVDSNIRLKLKQTLEDVDKSKGTVRVTKKDLTGLLRDRNFCSFQDGHN